MCTLGCALQAGESGEFMRKKGRKNSEREHFLAKYIYPSSRLIHKSIEAED